MKNIKWIWVTEQPYMAIENYAIAELYGVQAIIYYKTIDHYQEGNVPDNIVICLYQNRNSLQVLIMSILKRFLHLVQ